MQTCTIGQGAVIHAAYVTAEGNLLGSLCNPFAWERSRVVLRDRPVTCGRCAKATARRAEVAALLADEGPSHNPAACSVKGCAMGVSA